MSKISRLTSKIKYVLMNENQRSDAVIEKLREGGAVIGNNVDILNSTIDMGEPYLIEIGDNVTITNATLLTHDASTKKALGYTKVGRVSIGSDVFVGLGAIILPDTRIGSKVIVGAGTVVAKDIPDNSVVGGNPCKVICTYDDYIEKNKKTLESGLCFDKYPSEFNDDEKMQLKVSGKGFMR